MHLKGILSRVKRHEGCVYRRVRFVDGLVEPELEVDIEPRGNSRLVPRRFQFVPLCRAIDPSHRVVEAHGDVPAV